MLTTRTGNFKIGFRRGWGEWQRDLTGMLSWAKANDIGVVDLGNDGDTLAQAVTSAGLSIGSVDLKNWHNLISADPDKRLEAVESQIAYIEACAEYGVRNFFAVMLPEDPSLPRKDNFGYMVDSLNALAPTLAKFSGHLVIEGWPGPGALACTPEGYRALLKECPTDAIGINFDPSHLIRMGIDPIRFVEEFATRIFHVHGKDTEIISEALYEFGTEQPATFDPGHGFGGHFWRYTIPGHGVTRWIRAFQILRDAEYKGAVCVELEDENYNGTEDGEKAGILAGAKYLAGC